MYFFAWLENDSAGFGQGFAKYLGLNKELGNIKSWHWDLYAKPDASIGFNKKP